MRGEARQVTRSKAPHSSCFKCRFEGIRNSFKVLSWDGAVSANCSQLESVAAPASLLRPLWVPRPLIRCAMRNMRSSCNRCIMVVLFAAVCFRSTRFYRDSSVLWVGCEIFMAMCRMSSHNRILGFLKFCANIIPILLFGRFRTHFGFIPKLLFVFAFLDFSSSN